MSFAVPQSVQKVARDARLAHQRTPIAEEVSGVTVAEKLEAGVADAATVKRMRRFFAVQGRHFESAKQLQHTFGNSALMRSWALHGGDSGRVWCERVREEGLVESDPYVELLEAPAEDVYAHLSLGAWRWEYDMDPPRAARFVEEYHRATGTNLDLDKAFGSGRNAVAKAMMRRAQNESPFKQLAAALMRQEYREHAQLDLRQLRESIGQPVFNWPEFITFVMLAGQGREYVAGLLEGPPIPFPREEPEPVFAYSPPVASYITYFHPRGALFEKARVRADVRVRLGDLMQDVRSGRIEERAPMQIRSVLEGARTALARCNLAGGLGHVLLEAWAWQDWPVFRDAIPLDSPVREPFLRFEQVVDRPALTP